MNIYELASSLCVFFMLKPSNQNEIMDNFKDRLNFIPGKKNKMHNDSLKEYPNICKLAKFCSDLF